MLPLRVLKNRARQLQRSLGIGHCAALDRIARTQGYASWSLLAAKAGASRPRMVNAPPAAARQGSSRKTAARDADDLFQRLRPGESLLLGSRPGQGKTVRAVALVASALRQGLPCWFFSLANDPTELAPLFAGCADPAVGLFPTFHFQHSDELCADRILAQLRGRVVPRSLVVIDYLQLLDQRRSSPELQQQVLELTGFAQQTGCVFLFLSQLRSALDDQRRAPQPADVRLPNALDLRVFSRLLLLHRGSERWHVAG